METGDSRGSVCKREEEERLEGGSRKRERERKKEDAAKERRSPGWDALRRCREGGLYFGGTDWLRYLVCLGPVY